MTRRECPAMRAPTSFFLSFFLSCFLFLLHCHILFLHVYYKAFFWSQKWKKTQQVWLQIQLWINVQSWNKSWLIHWRGSAKFIVVLHQCNMNSKKHSWKFLMVKSQIEMHFWHTKLATEANLSAKWETLLNLNFHSYFEANGPNCFKVLC